MANQRNSNQRRPAARSAAQPRSSRSARSQQPRSNRQRSARRAPERRRPQRRTGFDLSRLLRPARAEFKPDSEEFSLLKMLHLTQVQRDRLLKWGLYISIIVLLLMIQDVIMSQVTIFGATTDLAVCIILLITVIEGVETGSVFVLLASCFFYFSGSSPGPVSVGLLCFLGIGACLFRQMYWHRNPGSIVLCAGLALMLYEIGTFIVGVATELTRWDQLGDFLVTGALSILVMIPLYSLINRIGQIGGNTWKE